MIREASGIDPGDDQLSQHPLTEVVEPRASNVIEALRDIGYTLGSAVADLIDNSISAEATHICLRFGISADRKPWFALIDDGRGMTQSELVEAMRCGGRDPLAERSGEDLGRFGLGLKTASFSQCRRATVVSRRNDLQCARQWDLDLVRRTNRWLLRTPQESELRDLPCLNELGARGTLVIWQELDRLDLGNDPERVHQVLNERMMSVVDHIALVFHRFLSRELGKNRVFLNVNGTPIEPADPFNAAHPATTHLPEETLVIEGQPVRFRPFILPHHSKVSAAEYERLAGTEGYLRAQGFYIYRNRRLIIHGTWFRMARQDELTRLARVQVDIPNTLDHLWTIDVRKSRAYPPEAVRKRLRGIVERIREQARRPYTHRGTAAISPDRHPLWRRWHENERITYRPDPKHPLLAAFRADLAAPARRRFDALMSVLGASLPLPMLFNDMASHPVQVDCVRAEHAALRELADVLIREIAEADPAQAEQIMRATQPFASVPEFIANYLAEFKQSGEEA